MSKAGERGEGEGACVLRLCLRRTAAGDLSSRGFRSGCVGCGCLVWCTGVYTSTGPGSADVTHGWFRGTYHVVDALVHLP